MASRIWRLEIIEAVDLALFLIAILIYAPTSFNPLWDILIDIGYIGMGYCADWDILVWDIL